MEGESQQHEEGDGLVGGTPLQEDLRLELVEYLMEDLFGDAEGGGAEEDPAGCYEVEGEDAAYELHGSVRSGSKNSLKSHCYSRYNSKNNCKH